MDPNSANGDGNNDGGGGGNRPMPRSRTGDGTEAETTTPGPDLDPAAAAIGASLLNALFAAAQPGSGGGSGGSGWVDPAQAAAFEDACGGAYATVVRYQNDSLQAATRALIPQAIHDLHHETGGDDVEAVAKALLRWFKKEFFTWTNSPPCAACGSKTTGAGMLQPNADERAHLAGRVEGYRCTAPLCTQVTRFPRYNDPRKLLETRTGRCGEWANVFTLCCVSMGLDARYVRDWTDHVWTEIYVPRLGRWCHADACENRFDTPLLYEGGWGKKLDYVLAFAIDEVVDVTRRYTRRWEAVLGRRQRVSEAWLAAMVRRMDADVKSRRQVGPERRLELALRRAAEETNLADNVKGGGTDDDASLPGRESGSAAWRTARGEIGRPSLGGDATCTSEARALPVIANKVKVIAMDTFDGAAALDSLSCVGSATLIEASGGAQAALLLTPPRNDCTGAAWFGTQSFDPRVPFLVRFTLRMLGTADGCAFVMQGVGPNAIGTGGSGLGYAGIRKSVAVEFDIYESWDSCEDPSGNHVAIMSRGADPNSAHHDHALACSSAVPPLASGRFINVQVIWTGESLVVGIGGEPVVEAPGLDLAGAMGGTEMWVGFTAATGGLNCDTRVTSWGMWVSAADGFSGASATSLLGPADGVPAEVVDAMTALVAACGADGAEGEAARAARALLLRYVSNIVDHPGEAKYRRVKTTNRFFIDRILPVDQGLAVMVALGFEEDDDTGALVYAPTDARDAAMVWARQRLHP